MTFALFLDAQTPAAILKSPVIKAADVADFTDALALLSEARRHATAITATADAACAAATEEGYRAGVATAQVQIEERLVSLATAFADAEAARRDEIAAAAFAAVRAVIGAIDDDDVIHRVVAATLARSEQSGPVSIEVTPALADRLATRLSDVNHVSVTANPALSGLDCHINFGRGKIVASLDLQLAALAERWGVAP